MKMMLNRWLKRLFCIVILINQYKRKETEVVWLNYCLGWPLLGQDLLKIQSKYINMLFETIWKMVFERYAQCRSAHREKSIIEY